MKRRGPNSASIRRKNSSRSASLASSIATPRFVSGVLVGTARNSLQLNPRNPGNAEREDLASWMLPGKLLERAGIHDDAYFALTQVLAPQLATLTRAPNAPLQPEDTAEQSLDHGMANVALLRMKGKLDPLLPHAQWPAGETGVASEPAVFVGHWNW